MSTDLRSFRGVLLGVLLGAIFWLLVGIGFAVVNAQDRGIKYDADVWCIQHHPCDWSAHTIFTWGSANVSAGILSVILPGSVSPRLTRWGMIGYYVQREIRQMRDFPGYFKGAKDASHVAPMPLWLDGLVFDLGGVALGAWLAPKPFAPGRRVQVLAGAGSLGLSVAVGRL